MWFWLSYIKVLVNAIKYTLCYKNCNRVYFLPYFESTLILCTRADNIWLAYINREQFVIGASLQQHLYSNLVLGKAWVLQTCTLCGKTVYWVQLIGIEMVTKHLLQTRLLWNFLLQSCLPCGNLEQIEFNFNFMAILSLDKNAMQHLHI